MFSKVAPTATALFNSSKVAPKRFAHAQGEVSVAPELQSSTLPNGIKVVTVGSKAPVSTVSVYVNAGPRNENPDNSGASFFLRRFGFKSTKNLSALRLVRTIELTTGNYGVGIGREHLVYASEVPTNQVTEILPILSEVLHPQLKEYEVNDELANVQADVEAIESNPRALAFELLHQEAYRNKGLGQSLHTPTYNLHNLDNKTLADFVNGNFTAENLVVVGTGGIEHSDFVKQVEAHFANVSQAKKSQGAASNYVGGEIRIPGDFDSHIVLGFQGAAVGHRDAHVFGVLRYVLGGGSAYTAEPSIGDGVSGRLNRNVVEANPWAQHASAFNLNYSDSGLFGVFAVASRGNVSKAVQALTKELKSVTQEITPEELARAKNLYKASILHNDSRLSLNEFVAKQAIYSKASLPADVAKSVDGISAQEVADAAKKALQSRPTLVVLGDISDAPTLDQIKASL